MVEQEQYLEIAKKYGHYASWAVWAEEGLKPKSNVGDLTIFDLEQNPNILDILNSNVVMVGLNISRPIEFTFGNFHDKRPQSQDYKIRFAFKNTSFYGAYMTDIIKDFEHLISGTVAKYLKSNKDFEEKNIEVFQQELADINAKTPTLVAFGNHAFNILDKYFSDKFRILKVPHYSTYKSKEDYKNKVEKITSNA